MAKLIFWLFVLFLALSFFGISIESIVRSPAGQANLAYVGQLLVALWNWLSAQAGTLAAAYHVS
jgi:hypothetical protein